jgi:hypothetical protein
VFGPNVARVLDLLREDDRVLDVGGWYRPFSRADVVVDLLPYNTRGLGGRSGPGTERFDESTWVVQDVCSTPLPFPDKSFDFVICSHTLEDVRDPIYLCSELLRVARSGYIEVPSRTLESIRGVEGRNYVGLYHHRWLVEIEHGTVLFRLKPHAIHESRLYHLPRRHLRRLAPSDRVTWLFWQGTFSFAEVVQISHLQTRRELAAFVERTAPLDARERLKAVCAGPGAAWHYRTWSAIRHPLQACVGPDTPTGDAYWGRSPEHVSSATARAPADPDEYRPAAHTSE